LYWYDMSIREAVSWRGILRVILWGLFKNQADKIALNYSKNSLYNNSVNDLGRDFSNPTVWNCKTLDSKPWHDDKSYLRQLLENQSQEIISEYKSIASEIGTHPDNTTLAPKGRWTGLFLVGVDGPNKEILKKFPVVNSILRKVQVCENFGFVLISGTEPGTIIAPHTGSSNLRLRNHLGIDIPEPNSVSIRVGSEWRKWEEGKTISFDDSYEHEVIHNGEKLRVVLSIDTWHPSLSRDDITFLSDPVFKDFGYFRT